MSKDQHFVAVIGGAVSGSEATHQFTKAGIRVVVFEQNVLPYGKIEDGLPKWHVKLRDKEINRINDKLSHPLVEFCPGIKLGEHLRLEDLIHEWGFSAIVLASGAWRDRPLPIEGIDDYIGKGFCYQNDFIHWYNHKHEPNYKGDVFDTPDDAIVIGGGLASLDVAKVIMFENVQKALKIKGHDVDLFTLDKSIAKILEQYGFNLAALGLKGCSLYYRRRIKDMPLTPMATDTPVQLEKAVRVREKVFNNYHSKYLFNFECLRVPVEMMIENDQLVGMVFQETEIINGRAIPVEGKFHEVRSSLFISSIGSLPNAIPGIPMSGSVYQVDQNQCCRIAGFKNVFAVGNAVTGRGNILESLKHGREITQKIIEQFDNSSTAIQGQVQRIQSQLGAPLTKQNIVDIETKIVKLQELSNYDGNYDKWIEKHLPIRLEQQLGKDH